jgi:hypothetical protein
LRFLLPACQGFQPLIGLPIEVLATGLSRDAEDGLWATRLRLRLGSETEYADRLAVQKVEQAAGTRPRIPGPAACAGDPGQKRPAGPDRPMDAFFVLTVTLSRPLPEDAAALAALLGSLVFPDPLVRLIPLVRKGQPWPGFTAEIRGRGQRPDAPRRAFLLHQPVPYPGHEGLGPAHVGLFVGGPHSPRVAALLPPREGAPPPPLSPDGEVRLLSDLARSLLYKDAGATALLLNRAGKVVKPAEIAKNQLGPDDREGQVPFLAWIDWDKGALEGQSLYGSAGMQSLGLPDVAVTLPEDPGAASLDRARDVVWYACGALAGGRFPAEAAILKVPRRFTLLPGSEVLVEDPGNAEPYRVVERGPELIVLCPETEAP